MLLRIPCMILSFWAVEIGLSATITEEKRTK